MSRPHNAHSTSLAPCTILSEGTSWWECLRHCMTSVWLTGKALFSFLFLSQTCGCATTLLTGAYFKACLTGTQYQYNS